MAIALLTLLVVLVLRHRSRDEEHAPEPPAPAATVPRASKPDPKSHSRRVAPEDPPPTDSGGVPTPDVAPPPSPSERGTGVSIEIVGEDGARLGEGSVTFKSPPVQLMQRGMAPIRYLTTASVADANPVVLRDLPADADGLEVEATAHVPGLPPAAAKFTLQRNRVTSVRLVVPRGRTVDVRVVDRDDDTPIAGASVVSVTELTSRGVAIDGVRGKPGPGSAVTDVDGRCLVGELGAGDHAFEVEAPDHLRGEAVWTDGALLVRLDRVRGTGTVTVAVTGPDSRPAAGVTVVLMDSDRTAVTAADGRAVFDLVPAGLRFFRLDLTQGPDFDMWADKLGHGMSMLARAEVQPGGHHDVALGLVRGKASLEAHLVAEDGSPLAGVKVTLMLDLAIVDATSDAGGVVRLADVDAASIHAWVEPESGTSWLFERIDLAPGERVSATWRLGSAIIHGRVVKRTGAASAADALVWISNHSLTDSVRGSASTDDQGRFDLSHVRVGKFIVTARTNPSGEAQSRPIELVVPTEAPLVLELIDCGRIAATFAAADRAALHDAKFLLRSTTDRSVSTLGALGAGSADLLSEYVLPGTYEVTVELAGRKRAFPVEVKGAGTFAVELRAP